MKSAPKHNLSPHHAPRLTTGLLPPKKLRNVRRLGLRVADGLQELLDGAALALLAGGLQGLDLALGLLEGVLLGGGVSLGVLAGYGV